jgi:hypothetical protein
MLALAANAEAKPTLAARSFENMFIFDLVRY